MGVRLKLSGWWIVAVAVAIGGELGCDPGPGGGALGGDAEPSPNASIPARRLSVADAAAGDAATGPRGLRLGPDAQYLVPDAAPPPPTPLDADEAMSAEPLVLREQSGVSLSGHWVWRDVPAPMEGPAVDVEAIRAAREATQFGCKIDLTSTGRMRFELLGLAQPLLRGAAILARADRYGAVVVWPNDTHYRVAPPGSMRALFGDRRVDVAPLEPGTIKEIGTGSRLDHKTRTFELSSAAGRARIETAKLPEASIGAPLLCRLVAELVGVHPATRACVPEEVLLMARLDWSDGGGLEFDANALAKSTTIPGANVLVPPPGATFRASGLPVTPEGVFLARDELDRFRKEPVERTGPTDRGAPGEGLIAVNQSDRLMYVLVDGVPVVAVPPWAERYLIGPKPGRYRLQWRTFLGDVVEPAFEAELPARVRYGQLDAGAGGADGG